ncbi:hypothetical protein C8J57DRAFT_1479687 [Mycena rebaudengoi]|nr:hypothetical protein C8J57DRAFT_1479687 [Mycena rebaudengoi]
MYLFMTQRHTATPEVPRSGRTWKSWMSQEKRQMPRSFCWLVLAEHSKRDAGSGKQQNRAKALRTKRRRSPSGAGPVVAQNPAGVALHRDGRWLKIGAGEKKHAMFLNSPISSEPTRVARFLSGIFPSLVKVISDPYDVQPGFTAEDCETWNQVEALLPLFADFKNSRCAQFRDIPSRQNQAMPGVEAKSEKSCKKRALGENQTLAADNWRNCCLSTEGHCAEFSFPGLRPTVIKKTRLEKKKTDRC